MVGEEETQTSPATENTDLESTSWKEWPLLLVKGFLMGSADIVPGVSGGTLALILGIYERLINAIKSANTRFLTRLLTFRWQAAFQVVHWKFLFMLFSGIVLAIIFFTRVVPLQVYMFTKPELIFGLFFGLIVGSIYILVKVIDALDWRHGLFILFGTLVGFWVVTLVPTDTPETSLFVFFSGSIAICAMILPGISGSYLLLILRKYDYILSQVAALGESLEPVLVLLTFFAGAAVGLALFSRLLSWLLDRYYGFTLAVLIGFLIGSLYVIWPYQDRTYHETVRKTEIVDYDHPRAETLREHGPDKNRPEYERLGPVKTDGPEKRVEIQTIKQKMIKTTPYIPYLTREDAGTQHFWSGIIGMIIGLAMVGGLDYLRSTELE
ncbi:DUF368 domain-containing protein [Halalkalibaculum sp. DA3122]|uniref:DUF368 domain-containing protein n=1 Tax=Halalkalibaculum sp. DA384 TaxID=3373606 RepID=UPI0037547E50